MNNIYDVIVLGGGIAGCSAALSAVRHGKKVLLIEKLTVLGGLATTGHIVIYLPLDDGYGNKVIGGISEELLRLSAKYAYYAGDFSKWKEDGKRYECKYNGPAFSLALEELLLNEKVDILYDTLFVGSKIEDNIVKSVFVENKSGKSEISCRSVVDATGDADLFFRAGEETDSAPNSLAIWNYCTQGADEHYQKRGGADAPGLKLVSFGTIDVKKDHHEVSVPYYGDNANGINSFIIDGHRSLLNYMKQNPSFVPASLPGMAQIRMARRIKGCYEISNKDANMHFKNNVGGTGDWRKPGPVYEVILDAMYTKNIGNVLASGRCICTSNEAWEIFRCIPQSALTGQIAGTAVSLCLDNNCCVQELNIENLRKTLAQDKVILDVNGEK